MPKKKRKPLGVPPGSLIFTGQKKMEEPDVTILKYHATGIEDIKFSEQVFTPPPVEWVTWYDVRGLHKIELVERLGKAFEIHPLVLEDVLDTHQRPKFEEYDSGFFLIVRSLKFEKTRLEIQTEQIAIYVGNHFAISFQEDADDLFKAIRTRLHNGRGKIRLRGADYLAYALVDLLVDNYFHTLDAIEEVIETLEDEIVNHADSSVKSRIHQLKQAILVLRKSVAPLREAINRFAKSDHPYLQENTSLYLRDLYDHTIQVIEMVDTYRDTITGLHDLYLSEISFKMNQVMQVLTIISTIFIPLTFLAGIYGMNFDNIPELHWQYSYFVLWGIMLLITLGLIYFFSKKKWL